VEFAGTP